jgi:uncharacterized protein (DUF305 family)
MLKNAGRFALLLILIPAIALAAGRQDANAHGRGAAGGPDWSEFMASMKTMDAAMASVQPSADCDINFVRLMLPHHQAAIDMAKTQLLHGTDPQLRRLAQEIITDQQSEIQLMQLWLKQHEASAQDRTKTPALHPNQQQ